MNNFSNLQFALLFSILFFVLLALAVKLSEFYLTIIRRMPPYVSSEKGVYEAMKKYLELRYPDRSFHIVELGCGDSRGLRYLTCDTDWSASGYELGLFPYFLSWIGNRLCKNTKVALHYEDFFNADLAKADVVYSYLYDDVNRRLEDKFNRELQKGTLIFSYAFTFPHLHLVEKIKLEKLRHSYLHVYRIE